MHVGNGKYTEEKFRQFPRVLGFEAKLAANVMRGYRFPGRFLYWDAYAGPGRLPDRPLYLGSPLRAIQTIQPLIPNAEFMFCDIVPTYCDDLRRYVADLGVSTSRVSIRQGDQKDILLGELERIHRRAQPLGLLFVDPNGEPDFKHLQYLSEDSRFGKIDLLAYVSATRLKRLRIALKGRDPLVNELARIQKKVWLVLEPSKSAHQWMYLLGTNWENFPAWEKNGLYRVDSERGDQIINAASFTKAELSERMQLALPI